jgi:hypothetical protein
MLCAPVREGGAIVRTCEEIQRVHDMLVAIILGEVKIEVPAGIKECMAWNAAVLCWVLKHSELHQPAGMDFAKCVEELQKNLAARGYAQTRAPLKKLGALRVDGLHVFAFDQEGKQVPELQASVADLLAEAGERLGWEMQGQVIETRGGGDWELFRNPDGKWNRRQL